MGRDKDKHGKGRNDDWEREKESIAPGTTELEPEQ